MQLFKVLILFIFLLPDAHALEASKTFEKEVADFIGKNPDTTQIFELDQSIPSKSKTKDQPWSGTYWPLDMGSIAAHYQDGLGLIRLLMNPKSRNDFFLARLNRIQNKLNKLDQNDLENLAPSEKYDLYIGDHDFTLTRSVIQSIQEQVERVKHLQRWEGSCQGWATASAFSPRPSNAITLPSLDGKFLIPFYPDDLKALSTLLWANSLIQDYTRFSGQLCQNKNPSIDPRSGKVLDTTCKGVNPALLHLSILELIGKQKTSFIINRVNNTQVWNQPLAGYEFNYFNLNNDQKGSLNDSIIAFDPKTDLFGEKVRAEGTRSLVGVQMTLYYTKENNPTHRKTDSSERDTIRKMEIRYDLELNESNQIIGGEWRNAKTDDEDTEMGMPVFPGFIWRFRADQPIASSVVENPNSSNFGIDEYDSEHLIPLSKQASAFRYKVYGGYDANGNSIVKYKELKPQPLARVVNELVELSRRQ